MFQYAFEWTPSDQALWIQASLAAEAGVPSDQPVRVKHPWRATLAVIGVATALAGLIIVFVDVGQRNRPGTFGVVTVLAGVALLTLSAKTKRQLAVERVAAQFDRADFESKVASQSLTLSIDRDAVRSTAIHTESIYRWSSFTFVYRFGAFVVLESYLLDTLIAIPTRVIGDKEAVDHVLMTFHNWMLDGGGGEEAYVYQRLAELRPAPCRQCGYDLHGLKSRLCPECGGPITLNDQPGLFR